MSIDAAFAHFFDYISAPRQHANIYYPYYDGNPTINRLASYSP